MSHLRYSFWWEFQVQIKIMNKIDALMIFMFTVCNLLNEQLFLFLLTHHCRISRIYQWILMHCLLFVEWSPYARYAIMLYSLHGSIFFYWLILLYIWIYSYLRSMFMMLIPRRALVSFWLLDQWMVEGWAIGRMAAHRRRWWHGCPLMRGDRRLYRHWTLITGKCSE